MDKDKKKNHPMPLLEWMARQNYWRNPLSTEQAAHILGVSAKTIRRLIEEGRLPFHRTRHNYQIPRQAVYDRLRCDNCTQCGRCHNLQNDELAITFGPAVNSH